LTNKDGRKDSVTEADIEGDDSEALDCISTASEELNSSKSLAKYLESHSHATYSIRAMSVQLIMSIGFI
jgi:hypothetical protein